VIISVRDDDDARKTFYFTFADRLTAQNLSKKKQERILKLQAVVVVVAHKC